MKPRSSVKVVRLRAGIVVNPVAGGAVVVDPTGGAYFQVNAVGHEILSRLLESVPETDLVKTLQLRFGLSRERAQKDVQDFLQQLRSGAMLEESA